MQFRLESPASVAGCGMPGELRLTQSFEVDHMPHPSTGPYERPALTVVEADASGSTWWNPRRRHRRRRAGQAQQGGTTSPLAKEWPVGGTQTAFAS